MVRPPQFWDTQQRAMCGTRRQTAPFVLQESQEHQHSGIGPALCKHRSNNSAIARNTHSLYNSDASAFNTPLSIKQWDKTSLSLTQALPITLSILPISYTASCHLHLYCKFKSAMRDTWRPLQLVHFDSTTSLCSTTSLWCQNWQQTSFLWAQHLRIINGALNGTKQRGIATNRLS